MADTKDEKIEEEKVVPKRIAANLRRSVCESILRIYFSPGRDIYLSKGVINAVQSLRQHMAMNDKINNIDDLKQLRAVYGTKLYKNRDIAGRECGMSPASLYRFRRKVITIFSNFLIMLEDEYIEKAAEKIAAKKNETKENENKK